MSDCIALDLCLVDVKSTSIIQFCLFLWMAERDNGDDVHKYSLLVTNGVAFSRLILLT